MVSTEHFISFGTDLVGIERILRGFQAICALLVWYPALFAFVESKVSSPVPLGVLGGQINVSRRFIRFFRFLDSFQAGWKAFISQGNKGLDGWLDIVSKTCFGMFGMMETMTLLDLCGIENLRIFSVEKFAEIEYQGQLFWFAGLYTSIMVSVIRLFRLLFSPPAAVTKESVSTASTEDTAELVTAEKEASSTVSEKSSKEELDKERKRLKGIVAKRKAERGAHMQKLSSEGYVLLRGLVSDVLDLLLPASTLGWVKVYPGTVASVMFFTTLTTGSAVWDKVGRELQMKKQ